ncbi:MAG: 4'-phosphopantetheinyl transferase family protein [Terriglobia bacterium]
MEIVRRIGALPISFAMSSVVTDINEYPWKLARHSTEIAEGEVHVWLSNLSAACSVMSLMERTLSDDEVSRASRYLRKESRLEFTLGRGLLRLLLGSYLERDPGELKFTAGLHGKPEVTGDPKLCPVQFNVSHSHGAVLHAFSLGRRVGVDIERIRQDFSGHDVAQRFFSRREAAFISSQPEASQPKVFFTTWARKEALLKARGMGLSGSLDGTEIPQSAEVPEMLVRIAEETGESSCWFVADLDAGANFAAALAVEGMNLKVTLRRWVGEEPHATPDGHCKAQAAAAFKSE